MAVFFVALIIVYFILSASVKSDEAAWQRSMDEMEAARRKSMGHGRDNIYQFKIYCYNMRCLLELAQVDGIGVGEERNETFYDKHCDEISQQYCHGQDPVHWCMHKAIDTVLDEHYLNSWQYSECGESYYDERDLAHNPMAETRVRYENSWTAFKSEYNRSTVAAKRIKGINLPRDGITEGNEILRGLYYLNHAFEFNNVNGWNEDIAYYMCVTPGKKFDKKTKTFEESGITLYN